MTPAGRRFLILHGVENRRPCEHWQHWLAEELRTRREVVLYPQLPDPDGPDLDTWLELIRAELAQLGDGERVVLCHSLAAVAWLHLAGGIRSDERVDRVLLVAPPSRDALWPEIADFAPPPDLSAAAARSLAGTTRMVCGDRDPYCPAGADRLYGTPLEIPVDVLPGAGHVRIEDGYGPWPGALAWCLDGVAPVGHGADGGHG